MIRWPGHKANWLRQLLAVGLRPEVEVLETHETAEALVEAEKHFIAYFRSIGCRLTNQTDGGDGIAGCVRSDEFRRKLSRYHRGRPKTEEHRLHLSRSRGGRQIQDETGAIYVGVQDAARRTGMWPTSIIRSLTRGHLAKGHTFKYVEAVCS